LGFGWTIATRQRAFFVEPSAYSQALRSRLEREYDARRRFAGAVEANVHDLTGRPFPIPRVPVHYHLVPYEWEPSVRHVDEPVDLTDGVVRSLGLASGLPADLEWPPCVRDLLAKLLYVRVFRCRRWAKAIDVVACYVAAVTFSAGAEPSLAQLGNAGLHSVQTAYDAWLAPAPKQRPVLSVFTVGTGEPPVESLTPDASADRWTLISYPSADGRWTTSLPERFGDRLAILDFLDSLKPETEKARHARIKQHVDQVLPVYPGHITAAKVAAECGLRRSPVAEAFEVLQGQSPEIYRLYVTDGQLAIRSAKPGEELSLARAARWRSLIRRHSLGLCGAAVGAAAWRLHGAMPMSTPLGVSLALFCGYTGNQIQRHIQRRIELSKE
jgi:hypothetical protein